MGGSENVLLTILEELNSPQYEITVLLNYRQGEFLQRVPKGIKILSIASGTQNFSSNKFIHLFQKSIRRLKYFWFQKFPQGFYRRNNLMDYDFEIAFTHYMFDDVLNSPNKISKKIFWIHGDMRNSGFSSDKNKAIIEKMKQFDQGVFVSHFSKKSAENISHTTLPNAQVIHNPIPIESTIKKSQQLPQKEFGKIDFVSVGRLFWQKGFLDLLKAHIRLRKEGFQIRTLLLGDGPQRTELEEFIRENDVVENFILGGFQDNPYPYIKNAACFILPSYSEGYPLVIAEALLLNTYVLSTDVGGIPEMIDSEKLGTLCKPGEENIYQLMKQFLVNDENANRTIKSDKKIIEKNNEIFSQLHQLFSSSSFI